MKTLTKKAIVLASAIAVAGAFAVCAADVTVGTITNPTTAARSVTVPFTTDVAATDQITILAYNTDLGATPDATNIVFIDQVAKGTLTDITFSLRDADPTGNYKVLMGGTGVAAAGNATFALESDAPTTGSISGTVTGYSNASKPSITITGGEVNQTVTAGDDDTYSVDVPAGTYTVALTLKNHITRTVYDVAVASGTPTVIPTTGLYAGDALADNYIDGGDLDVLNAYWATGSWDGELFSADADINSDEYVDGGDVDLVNQFWALGDWNYDE